MQLAKHKVEASHYAVLCIKVVAIPVLVHLEG